jgi:hypothetical protein
MQAKSTPSFF